jgi:hypothetical protein
MPRLLGRGVAVEPIQDDGYSQFFQVRDLEGNVIEVCTEAQ